MPQSNDGRITSAYRIPDISPDDLFAFHEAHFSQTALACFGTDFIDSPSLDHAQNDAVDVTWVEEDDGLGYYSDGVKRTLTNEQIEIFRHSELQALGKEKDKTRRLGAKEDVSPGEAMDLSDNSPVPAPADKPSSLPTSFQSNKKRRKKGSKRPRPEPKPDLRKRTWDVVEKGLDSLDYD